MIVNSYSRPMPLDKPRFGKTEHNHAHHDHDHHDHAHEPSKPKQPSRVWKALTALPRWIGETLKSGVNMLRWLLGNETPTGHDHHDHAPGEACDHPDHNH